MKQDSIWMPIMVTIAATVIENISDIHKNFEKNDERRIQTKTKLMELRSYYGDTTLRYREHRAFF